MAATFEIPKLVFGIGSLDRLPQEAARLGGTRILIICDPVLEQNGLIQKVTEKLTVPYATFTRIVPEPPVNAFEEALSFAREDRYDLILAVGGGSAIDTAKLVSVMLTNPGNVRDYFGVNLIPQPGIPVIAIPTTAGTGSEVTPIAILTVEEEEVKKGIVSPHMIPRTAILDATLTVTMPPSVTAATGLDAFVHALEGYISVGANRSALTDALCLEAISVIWNNLSRAYCQPDDLEARDRMLYGAAVAGMAFAHAGVGAVHALAYPLGAKFHVSHGVSNAMLLPHVMKWNKVACRERFVAVAQAMGLATEGKTKRQIADEVVEEIRQLAAELGIPRRLSEVGVKQEDLRGMARSAIREQRLLVNNPRRLSEDDIYQIYLEAL